MEVSCVQDHACTFHSSMGSFGKKATMAKRHKILAKSEGIAIESPMNICTNRDPVNVCVCVCELKRPARSLHTVMFADQAFGSKPESTGWRVPNAPLRCIDVVHVREYQRGKLISHFGFDGYT